MKNLYCPWRQSYSDDTSATRQQKASAQECVFCIQFALNQDKQHFILKRYAHNVVILNKYPYNAGHLLVIPLNHVSDLDQLSTAARQELMELTNQCTVLLRNQLQAQGINVGMNLGHIGGAGIPSHIHMHVIPRYDRDTNFLATVAQTKVISYDLHKIFATLKSAFQ